MNRNKMPLMMMLISGVVTLIAAFFNEFELVWILFWTLLVMILFYGFGVAFQYTIQSFEKQNEKIREEQMLEDEGEVLEKELEKSEVIEEN